MFLISDNPWAIPRVFFVDLGLWHSLSQLFTTSHLLVPTKFQEVLLIPIIINAPFAPENYHFIFRFLKFISGVRRTTWKTTRKWVEYIYALVCRVSKKNGFQDYLIGKIRQPIESFFNRLIAKTQIQRASPVRSTDDLLVHCFGKLTFALLLLVFYSWFTWNVNLTISCQWLSIKWQRFNHKLSMKKRKLIHFDNLKWLFLFHCLNNCRNFRRNNLIF